MEYQIQEYDSFRESMKELQTLCNWIPDTSTKEGYDKSKRLSLDGRKVFNALEDARKLKKKLILDEGRLIDSEAKTIQEAITEAIQPHIDAYKEVDNRERIRKTELEAKIDARIEAFRNCVVLGSDMESDELAEMVNDLRADPLEDCYHRTADALKVRNDVVTQLEYTLKRKLEEEAERKAEAEKAAEREAAAKLEAERLAEERKQFEAEKAKVAAEQAERDRITAAEHKKQEAERAEIEAAQKKIREAQEKADREEFERKAAQEAKEQAERNAAMQKERDEQAAAEKARREAEEQARVEAQKPDLEKLAAFGDKIDALIKQEPDIPDEDVRERMVNVINLLCQARGLTI